MTETILEMQGIRKSFPGVKALKGVDFSVRKGEIHALVGQNGAGKSTLLKILSGVYAADGGKVIFNGETLDKWTPIEMIDKGIALIYQELNLVQSYSIAQNMFIGRELRNSFGLIKWKEMRSKAKKALERVSTTDFDVSIPVSELSAAKQQLAAIATALDRHPKLLILDEPTSRLSLHDAETLFALLEQMREEGISIIYVSHRLNEIYRISDRITVLRDGEHIATETKEEMPPERLVEYMVGEDVKQDSFAAPSNLGDTVLKVENLSGIGTVHSVDFELRGGEVLGLVGAVGAGKSDVLRLLFGIDNRDEGSISIQGKNIKGGNPKECIEAGMALCPEDRKYQGLVLDDSIQNNITLAGLKKFALQNIFTNRKREADVAQDLVKRLQVATPSISTHARSLSGGNQQKVVLAKWLCTESQIFLFDEPTVGIDIQGKAEIYKLMHDLAQQGAGILFVTSDIEEGLAVSHRVLVMYRGSIVAELDPATTSIGEASFLAMGGTRE